MSNKEYISQYAEYAMMQMRRYGIPASVTLAQGICESASGGSELSRKGNNHFGIKATSDWVKNGGQYLVYTDDKPNEKFCQYASVGDSYEHHSQFLKNNSRYSNLFKLSPDDYKGWTDGLQKAGYATGKSYASTLQNIIERNDLQKYDQMVMQEMKAQGKSFGVDANPRQVSEPVKPETKVIDNEGKNYSFPVTRDEFMLITSPFGMRNDPINKGKSQMHKGVDIQAKYEAVLATEDKGKVIKVNQSTNTGGGKSVTVEYDRKDGSKYQCTYMHLSSIGVKVGDMVNAGQQLGMSGNTGTRTTGAHLHFGVKSISKDGVSRDIDPAAYLAEIAQKGNIQLQAMCNGKDILNKYKTDDMYADLSNGAETNLSPEDWMKKLLSSEDSGVSMPTGDPIIEMAMGMFTSLMALALQIDGKTEDEKMQAVTDAAISRSIDLTSLFPSLKVCSLSMVDGKSVLRVDNGHVNFSHELTNAEMSKIQQALGSESLSDADKRSRISQVINGVIVSQQMSQNYQQGIDAQQSQSESVQIK